MGKLNPRVVKIRTPSVKEYLRLKEIEILVYQKKDKNG